MFKSKRIVLDNGLEVLFIKERNKHRCSAYLTVNVGGFTKDFTMDNKEYHLDYGIAHFLEHYLLEASIYGNAMKMFSDDYLDANGFTAPNRTVFFISTVHDFEENLVKLINIVNNPKFDKDKIDGVKGPVLREIDKSLDNIYRKTNEFAFKQVFHEIPFDVSLGTHEYISNLTIDEIKLFHKAFYNAKNEMLVIAGDLDEDKIIKLVSDTYSKFDNNHITVKKGFNEKDKVVKEKATIVDIDNFVRIFYKINISKLSPKDKDKLSYYMSFVNINNFSDRSELFKYITDNKISSFSISYSSEFGLSKKYLSVNYILYTDKYDVGEKLLLDKMNNLVFDEDVFNNWKNKQILTKINDFENNSTAIRDYMDNVYLYDYYKYDDVNFIKSLNLEECKKMIGKLDFSNYSVIYSEKEKKDE